MLLGVGATVFTVSYLSTGFAGAGSWDYARTLNPESSAEARKKRRTLAYGATLMVPVVGPFVGIGFSGSATRSMGLLISGALQLSGLTMAVLGTRGLIRWRRHRRLAVGGLATATGAHASVSMRF